MLKTVVKAKKLSMLADKLAASFLRYPSLKNSPEECDGVNQLLLQTAELLDSIADDFEGLLDEISENVE